MSEIIKKNIFKVGLFFFISIVLIMLDQFSKFFAVKYIKTNILNISIKPIFDLVYVENTGAAFGIFKGMRFIFIIITIIAIIAILIYIYRLNLEKEKYSFICLILIFSGAIGNFIDRVRLAYVVDFINFSFIDFPVFNFADSYITIACFLIILKWILFDKKVNAT